jgi:hypothetical protein
VQNEVPELPDRKDEKMDVLWRLLSIRRTPMFVVNVEEGKLFSPKRVKPHG